MTLAAGMGGRLRSAPPPTSPWRLAAGPPSLPAPRHPETEEEYQALYQDRIFLAQSQQIFPMKEDLADWINKALGIEYLTGENFLDMLDNGVLVCQLARVIQERAHQAVSAGTTPGPVPTIARRLWSTASRGSFFARDNMDNFIQFCQRLGVHPNLLFESDDLVLQNRPRSVVLCLLEVARIAAARYAVEPPGLVQLEKEIAAEEEESAANYHSDSGLSHSSFMSWQFQPSPAVTPRHDRMRHSSSSSAIGSAGRQGRAPVARPRSSDRRSLVLTGAERRQNGAGREQEPRRPASEGDAAPNGGGAASDGAPSDTLEDDWSRASSEEPEPETDEEPSELDRRVQQATRTAQRQCQCPTSQCRKLKVRKVGEGKYNIAGRNVFIRLLKGRHMMVRVGGGWDTLEHFLLRHDPCQVKVVPRDKSASPYLHIQAKYRSPPPADHVGR
ncbi:growth arrest-specific protein 2-like [Bacillus rossius redtenbacheri]|uniref:growth arrest-specific protein 2-like n=1 Tax=Bacillus rossius redtenbacheri TaxID=93214 RepID=UPI002FDDBE6C